MTIYHMELAKAGLGISGGEVCMLELIKEYSEQGIRNIVLTTDNGQIAYEKILPESSMIEYRTISSYKYEKHLGVFISYLLRPFMAIKLVRDFNPEDGDGLICHSEFFPNSITAILLAKKTRNSRLRLGYFFHMLAPSIWRGYEGEFTGKFQIPRLTIIHYKLNQLLYRYLTPRKAVIFTVNSYYLTTLKTQYPHNKIIVLEGYAGTTNAIERDQEKTYDLLWVGRFHAQKGLLELPDIIARLKLNLPEIKVCVIGDGDPSIKKTFFKLLVEYGLSANVDYKGLIVSKEKDYYYNVSKILVMTSYFESFGQVNLEAMVVGDPVVAYDLPVFKVFSRGMIRVPVLDNAAMAHEIRLLLTDSNYYVLNSKAAKHEASSHSWRMTSESVLRGLISS